MVDAVGACGALFCSLLQRGEMFRGTLPEEEEAMRGACSEPALGFLRVRWGVTVGLWLQDTSVPRRSTASS